jgi:hypothetical protein
VLDPISSLERRIVGTESEFPQRAGFGQDGEESLPGPTNGVWPVGVSTPLCGLPWSNRRRLGKHTLFGRREDAGGQ